MYKPNTKNLISIANNPGEYSWVSKPGDVVFNQINPDESDHHGLVFNMNCDDNNGNSYIKFADRSTGEIMGVYNNAIVRINGKLIAKEITVKTDVWSDFVFEKEYKLLSLNELEKYINNNKHLPDVPDAGSVIENGINVAKMNVVLLQKIEELTLYLIEQEKRIKELEKTVKELKSK
jgi:hypothetical protein